MLPSSSLCREAVAVVEAVAPPAVVNHSIRSYLLARPYAEAEAIACDDDALCLAALFHDLGLCSRHLDRSRPFPESSNLALVEFLAERRFDAARRAPITDAVAHHFRLFPPWSVDPLAGLLQVGAWMDAVGRKRSRFRDTARAIEGAYPRLGFDRTFPVLVLRSLGGARSSLGVFFPQYRRQS